MKLRYLPYGAPLFMASLVSLACTTSGCGGSTSDVAPGPGAELADGAPAPEPGLEPTLDGAPSPRPASDAAQPESTPDAANAEDAGGLEDAAPTSDGASADSAGNGEVDASDGAVPAPPPDAGPLDASKVDAAPSDAAPDATEPLDASVPDAEAKDASPPLDAAVPDAAVPDAAVPDATVPTPDAAVPVPDASDIDAADASPTCVIPASAWTATVATPALPAETAPVVDSVLNVALPANDILYDPYTKLLYASVPSSFGADGNSIARIDPTTGAVLGTVYVGSEPGPLAESADGQFLYVGLNGASAIRRYTLATQTADLQFSLVDTSVAYGPVTSLQVLPKSPHSVLVGTGGYGYTYWVTVYDDGVARGVPLQQYANAVASTGSDALAFAPYDYGTTNVLCIDKEGIHLASTIGASLTPNNTALSDYPYVAGVLYSPGGRALDVLTGELAGTYATEGPLVVEPRVDRVFFLTSAYYSGSYNAVAEIVSYRQDHFTPAGTVTFTAAPAGSNGRLVRWGRYGFAFVSQASTAVAGGPVGAQIAILRTSLVPAGP